jgi:hypothetical protein
MTIKADDYRCFGLERAGMSSQTVNFAGVFVLYWRQSAGSGVRCCKMTAKPRPLGKYPQFPFLQFQGI